MAVPTGHALRRGTPLTASQQAALLQVRQAVQKCCESAPLGTARALGRALAESGLMVTVRTCVAKGFHRLRHSYLLVQPSPGGPAFAVDPEFKDKFRYTGLPGGTYASCVAALPQLFVGTLEVVASMVKLMSDALFREASAQGHELPPWRSSRALLSNWMPAQFTDELLPPPSSLPGALLHPILQRISHCPTPEPNFEQPKPQLLQQPQNCQLNNACTGAVPTQAPTPQVQQQEGSDAASARPVISAAFEPRPQPQLQPSQPFLFAGCTTGAGAAISAAAAAAGGCRQEPCRIIRGFPAQQPEMAAAAAAAAMKTTAAAFANGNNVTAIQIQRSALQWPAGFTSGSVYGRMEGWPFPVIAWSAQAQPQPQQPQPQQPQPQRQSQSQVRRVAGAAAPTAAPTAAVSLLTRELAEARAQAAAGVVTYRPAPPQQQRHSMQPQCHHPQVQPPPVLQLPAAGKAWLQVPQPPVALYPTRGVVAPTARLQHQQGQQQAKCVVPETIPEAGVEDAAEEEAACDVPAAVVTTTVLSQGLLNSLVESSSLLAASLASAACTPLRRSTLAATAAAAAAAAGGAKAAPIVCSFTPQQQLLLQQQQPLLQQSPRQRQQQPSLQPPSQQQQQQQLPRSLRRSSLARMSSSASCAAQSTSLLQPCGRREGMPRIFTVRPRGPLRQPAEAYC